MTEEPAFYEFGPYRAFPKDGTLLRDGHPVDLAPKVFATLLALLRQGGRLVTKEALMKAIWPDTFVVESNLAFNMSVLRKALGEGPERRYIETVPRRGYRFVGNLRVAPTHASPRPGGLPSQAVGRRAERVQLAQVLSAVREGRGQLVSMTGEPGLGKTTLAHAFLAEAPSPSVLLRGRCSEQLVGAGGYLPIIEALDDLLASEAADSVEPLLRALAPHWHQLSIRAGNDAESVAATSPERLKREFLTFIQALSQRAPTILFVDDLHWADTATTDLIDYLAHRVDGLPVLILVCYRRSEMLRVAHPFPLLERELRGRGLAQEIALPLLTRTEIEGFLTLTFPAHRLPPEFASFLHARTDGNPLFMVDVLRDLRGHEVIASDSGAYVLRRGLEELARELPDSVRSVIERKIGQLDPLGQSLLVAASVQGGEFDSVILAAMLEAPLETVEAKLAELERAHAIIGQLTEEELPDGSLSLRCRFVHGLYQNALFATLTPSRRASLSLACASAIVQRYGARAAGAGAQLGVLFEQGRDFARAAEHYLRTAHRAVQLFAYPEAVALARRGVAVLERLPAGPERDAKEVLLQTAMGIALMSTKGFSASEVQQAHARALALSRAAQPSRRLLPVLGSIWLFQMFQAQLASAHELAQVIVEQAALRGNVVLLAQAHQTLGISLMHLGDFVGALSHFEVTVSAYDAQRDRPLALQYAFDPGVAALACSGRVLVALGSPDTALARVQASVAVARALEHPPSLGWALTFAAIVHYLRAEPAATLACATEAVALAGDNPIAQQLGWATFLRGWALAAADPAAGIAAMRETIAAQQAIGSRISAPKFSGLLAEALRASGEAAEALERLDAALAECRATGERHQAPELHLFRARALVDLGHAGQARAALADSLATAQAMGAVWWELRAAYEAAALAGSDSAKAAAALAEILTRLREGHGLPLFAAARQRVAELGGRPEG